MRRVAKGVRPYPKLNIAAIAASVCHFRDTPGMDERSTVHPPNDVRIDCKAAKHSDEDRGAVLAPNREGPAGTAPPIERGLL